VLVVPCGADVVDLVVVVAEDVVVAAGDVGEAEDSRWMKYSEVGEYSEFRCHVLSITAYGAGKMASEWPMAAMSSVTAART